MESTIVSEAKRHSEWHALTRAAESQAQQMGMLSAPPFRELIQDISRRFSSQSDPQDDQELAKRKFQRDSVYTMIHFVSHADQLASFDKSAIPAFLEEAAKVAKMVLPSTQSEAVQLSDAENAGRIRLQTLSHDVSMRLFK